MITQGSIHEKAQELLDEARKLPDVACPVPGTSWQHPGYDMGRSWNCERCNGTGKILHPLRVAAERFAEELTRFERGG